MPLRDRENCTLIYNTLRIKRLQKVLHFSETNKIAHENPAVEKTRPSHRCAAGPSL